LRSRIGCVNRLCCGKTNPELEQEVAMPLLAADPVTGLPNSAKRHAADHPLALKWPAYKSQRARGFVEYLDPVVLSL
jgi:hypothetical protein